MSSTMVKLTAFPIWKNQKSSYYVQYEAIKNKMLTSIKLIKQEEANELSKILNAIIKSQQFKESTIAENIFNHLPSIINKSGENALNNLNIKNNFKVSTPETYEAWIKYHSAAQAYESAKEKGEENIAQEEEIKKLKSQALSLQGALNKIQGDVFEGFLQELLPYLTNKLEDFSQQEIDKVINDLESKLKSGKPITTIGSKLNTIEFKFNEETISISSQGKVDVSAKAPFLGEDFILGISAKNYSSLRNVHLLGKGSVLGLVSQWPTSQTAKNYFLNALTVYNEPKDVLAQGKIIFAIQSLIGRGDAELSNVLIVNTRNTNNPIRVLSTGVLLQQIDKSNIEDYFNFKFNPQLQLFAHGEDRTKEVFSSRIKSLTLDTSLNKKYLHYTYLNKLAQQ